MIDVVVIIGDNVCLFFKEIWLENWFVVYNIILNRFVDCFIDGYGII